MKTPDRSCKHQHLNNKYAIILGTLYRDRQIKENMMLTIITNNKINVTIYSNKI